MSFLSAITAVKPIEAIGNAFDKIFTSDEERAKAQIILEKLRQHPGELQVELNKIEAAHKGIFKGGWRSAVGWICVFALMNQFIIAPYVEFFSGMRLPIADYRVLFELLVGMLGIGALDNWKRHSK